jgi:hypothetical protein
MWILADYEPVAAFGLRPSNTTSSGGKSLVCPTPYALKMALLDRMIRHGGLTYGIEHFPLVRDLKIQVRVPKIAVINRTFQKVKRLPGGEEKKKGEIWTSTIAQREYCFHTGTMTLAFQTDDPGLAADLPLILSALNYFGRKGSFVQYAGHRTQEANPSPNDRFVDLCREPDMSMLGFGFLQRMDDMRRMRRLKIFLCSASRAPTEGESLTSVILPYHLKHHGFNHTVYEGIAMISSRC